MQVRRYPAMPSVSWVDLTGYLYTRCITNGMNIVLLFSTMDGVVCTVNATMMNIDWTMFQVYVSEYWNHINFGLDLVLSGFVITSVVLLDLGLFWQGVDKRDGETFPLKYVMEGSLMSMSSQRFRLCKWHCDIMLQLPFHLGVTVPVILKWGDSSFIRRVICQKRTDIGLALGLGLGSGSELGLELVRVRILV